MESPAAYLEKLSDPMRIERLHAQIDVAERRAKETYRRWAIAVKWDVEHERGHTASHVWEVILIVITSTMMALPIVSFSNKENMFALGQLMILVLVLLAIISARRASHGPMSPYRFFTHADKMPDLESIFAEKSTVWSKWLENFRIQLATRLRDDMVKVDYAPEYVYETLDFYLQGQIHALVKNMLAQQHQ